MAVAVLLMSLLVVSIRSADDGGRGTNGPDSPRIQTSSSDYEFSSLIDSVLPASEHFNSTWLVEVEMMEMNKAQRDEFVAFLEKAKQEFGTLDTEARRVYDDLLRIRSVRDNVRILSHAMGVETPAFYRIFNFQVPRQILNDQYQHVQIAAAQPELVRSAGGFTHSTRYLRAEYKEHVHRRYVESKKGDEEYEKGTCEQDRSRRDAKVTARGRINTDELMYDLRQGVMHNMREQERKTLWRLHFVNSTDCPDGTTCCRFESMYYLGQRRNLRIDGQNIDTYGGFEPSSIFIIEQNADGLRVRLQSAENKRYVVLRGDVVVAAVANTVDAERDSWFHIISENQHMEPRYLIQRRADTAGAETDIEFWERARHAVLDKGYPVQEDFKAEHARKQHGVVSRLGAVGANRGKALFAEEGHDDLGPSSVLRQGEFLQSENGQFFAMVQSNHELAICVCRWTTTSSSMTNSMRIRDGQRCGPLARTADPNVAVMWSCRTTAIWCSSPKTGRFCGRVVSTKKAMRIRMPRCFPEVIATTTK